MRIGRLGVLAAVGAGLLGVAGEGWAVIEAGVSVGIRDFAVLPDSGSGSNAPARMNLMTADPSGRLFVNDQRGVLYTVSADGSVVTPYLDVSSFAGLALSGGNEQGFQSFAFHPDFLNAGEAGYGKFYTLQNVTDRSPAPTFAFVSNTPEPSLNSGDSVVTEWSVDPTAATYAAGGGAAPREVLRLEQPRGNHNMGLISFNPTATPGSSDYGNLYAAVGDGGGGGDPWNIARDPSNPYGSILRIDPLDPDGVGAATYSVPSDNVFASDGDAGTLAEIYATGFRNPQRFGWDAATGDLFAADIGQNAREEISVVVNGADYGWDRKEGSLTFEGPVVAGLVDPIAEYAHSGDLPAVTGATGGRAVTVGEVVRGSGVLALEGMLLAGDFPTGVLMTIDVSGGLPAEGSGDGPFAELVLRDAEQVGREVTLLELINEERGLRGISSTNRTDLRYSVGTGGRVFVLNKRDGVIRELVSVPLALPEPGVAGVVLAGGLWVMGRRRRVE
ncbi:MAG: PQQ-dependent sugar dehydrogenase [Planctomycetota bacterium]